MLGIAASLSFLLMMFNVPVPGGTTAHAVGGTLLAIPLIGPYAASLALTVALLLQAFLFGMEVFSLLGPIFSTWPL